MHDCHCGLAAAGLVALLASAASAQTAAGQGSRTGLVGISRLHWTGATGSFSFGIAHGPAFDSTPLAGIGSVKLKPSGPGLSLDATVGMDGPGFLEWRGSVYHLGASRTVSTTSTVSGNFTRTTGTVPTGTISVDTTPSSSPPGAQAKVTTSAPAAGGGTTTTVSTALSPSSPPGNSVSQSTYSQTAGGGMYTALVTNGDNQTSAAYGLIYDQNGIAITGVAVSGWTTLTSNFRDTTNGLDQSLMLGRNLDLGSWELRPKIGVDALRTDRSISEATTYELAPSLAATASLPTVTLSQTERLHSHYLALMLGAGAHRPFGHGWRLDAAVDLGRAHMTGHYSGTTSVAISGLPGQSQALASQSYSAMSWIGRTTIGVSREVAPGTRVSLGIFCSYLSAVPSVITVQTGGTVGTGGTTTAGLSGSGQVQYTRAVVHHPQLTTGLSLGLVYRF